MFEIEKFRWGIEHEFPVAKKGGAFNDFSNLTYEELFQTIKPLPSYNEDYPGLRLGDVGVKAKRWYIEGFERFDETGKYLYTTPKGMEIRTPISSSFHEAVQTLQADFSAWQQQAAKYDFSPVSVSYNPFQRDFIPQPTLNAWEESNKRTPEQQTDYIYMMTYGPDLNLSHPDFDVEKTIAIAKKLTYYSPFIVPFSFSSPFYDSALWGGLSYRTYVRTGKRPAVMTFVPDETDLLDCKPTLTEKARLPAEVGRIEFKAFDTVADLSLYESLCALLLGLVLDETLTEMSAAPDGALHKRAAQEGFEDDIIAKETKNILDAAQAVLPNEHKNSLDRLYEALENKRSQSHDMINYFKETGNIAESIDFSTASPRKSLTF